MISVCVSVIYVFIYFTVLIPVTPFFKVNLAFEILREISASFVVGPLIVLLLGALYKSNKMIVCLRKSQHFTSTDYLLVFASSALFVYSILRIIALIGLFVVRNKIDIPGTIFQILFWSLSIVHIWGQTQFIMTTQYINRSEQKIPKFARLILIYLIPINAALWLCHSVANTWVEKGNSDRYETLITMFGESQAKVTMLIFLQFWDIYCFHSAFLAYKLLKNQNHSGGIAP